MPLLQERHEQIRTALIGMQKQFADMDGPGRVKAVTKFGADFVLPVKLTHAASALLGGIGAQARGMRSIQNLTGLLDDNLVIAQALEKTAEKTRELEVVTEQGFVEKVTAEFMEAETTVAQLPKIVPRPLRVLIDEICTKYNGVIPPHCKALRKEFKTALKQLEQQLRNSKLEQLKKLYGQKTIDNVLVKVELQHIYNFELNIVNDQRFGGFVLDIKGGHCSGVCESLEKTGLIKIVKKELLSTGVIEYVLKDVLTENLFYKTEFPVHWAEEKLGKAIWAVYETGLDLKRNKSLYKIGRYDGLDITLTLKYIDNSTNKNSSFYKIETALPYITKEVQELLK